MARSENPQYVHSTYLIVNILTFLAFTRTLTVLYSSTLLSLLTHIQLNLLGRYKYVQSVLDLEREEKLRERQSFEASVSSLFWGGGDLAGVLEGLENDNEKDTLGLFGTGRTGGTERKFLTLSWWLVHVGWKEIGDRVRTAVEDVFDEFVSQYCFQSMVSLCGLQGVFENQNWDGRPRAITKSCAPTHRI